MALEDLEQVIEFIAQLRPESVQQMVTDWERAMQEVERKQKTSQDEMLRSFDDFMRRRLRVASESLRMEEDELDKHFSRVLEKAKQARAKGLALTKEMVEEEKKALQELLQEEEAAETRRRAKGEDKKGVWQDIKRLGSQAQGAFATATGINIPTSQAAILMFLAREVNAALTRSRELRQQEARLGAAGTTGIGGLEDVPGGFGLRRGVALQQAVESAVAQFGVERAEDIRGAAQALVTLVPTITEDAGQFNSAIEDAALASIHLGTSVQETAEMQGRIMQRFNLDSRSASDALVFMADDLRQVNKELQLAGRGQFSIAETVKHMVSLGEALVPFGKGIDESSMIVKKFAKELQDGILSVQDLQQVLTGAGRRPEGTRAFIGQMISDTLGGRREFKELTDILQGRGALELENLIEGIMQTPDQIIRDLRAAGEDVSVNPQLLQRQLQAALPALAAELTAQTLGSTTGFERSSQEQFMLRQFENIIAGFDPNDPRQQRMARRRAFAAAGVGEPTLREQLASRRAESVMMREEASELNESMKGMAKNYWFNFRNATGEIVGSMKDMVRAYEEGNAEAVDAARARAMGGILSSGGRVVSETVSPFANIFGTLGRSMRGTSLRGMTQTGMQGIGEHFGPMIPVTHGEMMDTGLRSTQDGNVSGAAAASQGMPTVPAPNNGGG